jgi:hypothetical protein
MAFIWSQNSYDTEFSVSWKTTTEMESQGSACESGTLGEDKAEKENDCAIGETISISSGVE